MSWLKQNNYVLHLFFLWKFVFCWLFLLLWKHPCFLSCNKVFCKLFLIFNHLRFTLSFSSFLKVFLVSWMLATTFGVGRSKASELLFSGNFLLEVISGACFLMRLMVFQILTLFTSGCSDNRSEYCTFLEVHHPLYHITEIG